MTDVEILRQAFDRIGVKYVYHDDRTDDCNCQSESLHLVDDEVVFWFGSGIYENVDAF